VVEYKFNHSFYSYQLSSQSALSFSPLKTKRRLLYLKTQSLPRSKHFSSWL